MRVSNVKDLLNLPDFRRFIPPLARQNANIKIDTAATVICDEVSVLENQSLAAGLITLSGGM